MPRIAGSLIVAELIGSPEAGTARAARRGIDRALLVDEPRCPRQKIEQVPNHNSERVVAAAQDRCQLSMRLAAMVARYLAGLPNRYLLPCARFR